MERPRIITPIDPFGSTTVPDAAERLGLSLAFEMTGTSDGVEGRVYEAPDGTRLRHLHDPDLEIAVLAVEGPRADEVRAALAAEIGHVSALAASVGYDPDASEALRITYLRILCAHALEEVTDPMRRVAALAVRDPSPFVRLGVVQLFRCAMDGTMAQLVDELLTEDEDPNVRELAIYVLEEHWDPMHTDP